MGAPAGTTSIGNMTVHELLWGDSAQAEVILRACNGGAPFDVVLCSDCVYHEALVGPLLQTVLHVCAPKATILVAYEVRAPAVHAMFLAAASKLFTLRTISPKSMAAESQCTDIKMYSLTPRPAAVRRAKRALAVAVSRQDGGKGRVMAGNAIALARAIGSGEDILASATAGAKGKASDR